MADKYKIERIVDLERAVLRAICCESPASPEARREEIREATGDLKHYSWRVAEHVVVYKAITQLQPSSGQSFAEQLPAQATRMDFPDVDWNLYLRSSAAPRIDIADLIGVLKAETGAKT